VPLGSNMFSGLPIKFLIDILFNTYILKSRGRVSRNLPALNLSLLIPHRF
jgi:hypothetical protein